MNNTTNLISNLIREYSKSHSDLDTAIYASGLDLEVRVIDIDLEKEDDGDPTT